VELGNIEIDVSPKHNFPCYSPPPYFGLPVVATKWWPGSPFGSSQWLLVNATYQMPSDDILMIRILYFKILCNNLNF
jgi:hypothetical protein